MAVTIPPTTPETRPISTAGPRLVGGDTRLVRGAVAAAVAFASATALLLADWWWLAAALVLFVVWHLERRTFVQCTGTHVVVQNRCSRHTISRSAVDHLDARHGVTGARAELVLRDGARVPVAAWTLIEPEPHAVDAMLRRLGTELGVPTGVGAARRREP